MASTLTAGAGAVGDLDTDVGRVVESWIADVVAGDRAALERLYRAHHEVVRAFARRFLGDDAAAEDVVHEVFVAAPSALRRFRGEASLRTFLMSLAVNFARHHVRASMRRRAMHDRYADARALDPREIEPPDASMERRRMADRLLRALDALPVDQRVVVVLCEVEERTSVEAAAIVGAPEATVRTRLFHAKRKLRALLADEFEIEGER